MNKYLAVIFLTLFFTGCKEEVIVKTEKIIRPVKYQKIALKKTSEASRSFSGFAKPTDQAKISFKLNGTIQKINVKVGDTIKKDDVIAYLDPQIYLLQLQEAQSALINIEAQANNAEAVYKRVQSLYENQHASKNDLDNAKTGYEMTQSGIKTVKTKIEQATLQLSYAKIKSPADGKVAYVLAKENENIAAGYPVVVLNYGKTVEIEISVPDILINKINKDDKVEISFDVIKDKKFTGIVSEIGISPQFNAPTFPVIIKIEEQSDEIKAGMVAKVNINFEKDVKEKIVIPSNAVFGDKNNFYVYVIKNVDSNNIGKTEKRSIKVNQIFNTGFEVVEGLSVDELIVTAGISKIREDYEVKLLK